MFFKRVSYYLTLMEIEKKQLSQNSGNLKSFFSGNFWKFLSGKLKKFSGNFEV